MKVTYKGRSVAPTELLILLNGGSPEFLKLSNADFWKKKIQHDKECELLMKKMNVVGARFVSFYTYKINRISHEKFGLKSSTRYL